MGIDTLLRVGAFRKELARRGAIDPVGELASHSGTDPIPEHLLKAAMSG